MEIKSIFIVLLKFSENKGKANQFIEQHNKWIKQGFSDKVFLLIGSFKSNLGGRILVHNSSLADIKNRVKNDPFVKENIVTPEILEIKPSMVNDHLNFLFN